jgi:hypothetical protein
MEVRTPGTRFHIQTNLIFTHQAQQSHQLRSYYRTESSLKPHNHAKKLAEAKHPLAYGKISRNFNRRAFHGRKRFSDIPTPGDLTG